MDFGKADEKNVIYHIPVLADEVVSYLRPAPTTLILDGTLGGGGHSAHLLRKGASIIALDQDPEAVAYAKRRLSPFSTRIHVVQANFRRVHQILPLLNVQELGGALLDIGVSSRQLENQKRGFSIFKDGPLDMRMNPLTSISAADIVNTASLSELSSIFRKHGEEPHAFRIASRLLLLRNHHPIITTFDLVSAITSVFPRHNLRRPITRVFQALRIAVNDELGALQEGLEAISSYLVHGARFAVITFHSLEDRIVKHFFLEKSVKWHNCLTWAAPRLNQNRIFRLLTTHPITATREEIHNNPRARSAKLRVVERIHQER